MSVFKSYAEMSPDQRVAYDLGRLSVEQRLADAERALAKIQAVQPETVEMIRRHGFVFETPLDRPDEFRTEAERWEKLAFSIYMRLCEIESVASVALSAGEQARGFADSKDGNPLPLHQQGGLE